MAIEGESLLGFSDFFDGDVVIGKAVIKTGKPGKKAGGKAASPKRSYSKPARTSTVERHGKVLKRAHGTLFKAAQAIGRAQHVLSARPPAVQKPPLAAALPPKATAVVRNLPGRVTLLGAEAAATLSPKAKAAVARHNAAVAKARQAAKVVAQHAIHTKKAVQGLAQGMVNQKKVSKALRTPKGGRVHVGDLLNDPFIGGEVAEELHKYYDQVGAAPDPNNPGYLDDGTMDPAYGSAPTDPTMADPTLAAAPGAGDDVVDSGTTLPPAPDMNTAIPDLTLAGGILYHGEKGTPDGYVVSSGLATRATDHSSGVPKTAGIDPDYHYGYVWSNYHDEGKEKGIPFGDNMNGGQWNHIRGRWVLGHFRENAGAGRADTDNTSGMVAVDPTEAFASASKTSPEGVSYGPLIGNPALADFKGMRVDAQGNMGWLPQEAPDWLTFPLKQAAALTAQKDKAAADAQAKLDAATQAKATADAAAAQAAQDAANALAESQAASQQKIDQGTAETQAQQAMVQQAQADTQAQVYEQEQDKQTGQLLVQQAQQEQEQDKAVQDLLIAQAKKEQEQGYADDDGGGYVDPNEPPMPGMESGGGEGEFDDGAPIPGGDLMQDADGEGFVDDEG